jgi:hypothetical protein
MRLLFNSSPMGWLFAQSCAQFSLQFLDHGFERTSRAHGNTHTVSTHLMHPILRARAVVHIVCIVFVFSHSSSILDSPGHQFMTTDLDICISLLIADTISVFSLTQNITIDAIINCPKVPMGAF